MCHPLKTNAVELSEDAINGYDAELKDPFQGLID
jgi:hypothetical protein